MFMLKTTARRRIMKIQDESFAESVKASLLLESTLIGWREVMKEKNEEIAKLQAEIESMKLQAEIERVKASDKVENDRGISR